MDDEEAYVIYDWLDQIVLGLDCKEKEQVKLLIADVLSRLPQKDRDKLEKRGVHFIFPSSNCTAQRIIIDPKIARDERFQPKLPIWIVTLSQDFHKKSKTNAIYDIAHELAHVYLEHTQSSSGKEEFYQREIDADKQVIKWDFENELRQTPYNYIYGEGTIE
jgi:hypothetical protein